MTDYAKKGLLARQGNTIRRRQNRHVSDSNGFLSYFSRYQKPIALTLLGMMATVKIACSFVNYISKDHPAEAIPGYSRSAPQTTSAQTPESRLEQIAQQNNVVIPPAGTGVPMQNAAQQPVPAEKKEVAKETNAPGISVDSLADYITGVYKGWTKKDMPQNTAHDYSNWITKYANQYDIPPLLLTAAIAHESRFVNKDGDTKNYVNGIYNPSEGICQIGRLTQKDLRRRMGLKGKNIDLKTNPELAINMMAFYIDYLRDTKGISLWRALGHYNGGPGRMNKTYANKVMGEHGKIKGYFSKHDAAVVADRF